MKHSHKILAVLALQTAACSAGDGHLSGTLATPGSTVSSTDPTVAQGGAAAPTSTDGADGSSASDPGSTGLGTSASALSVNYAGDGCPASAVALSVPVTVNDSGNAVARRPAITSFLVPIAQSAGLASVSGLEVLNAAGKKLPAQFEVLARWGGARDDCSKSIRYAYAYVHAVPALGTTANWTVDNKQVLPASTSGLRISETAQAWVISTGTARFTVRRDHFQGLSKVELTTTNPATVVSDLGQASGGFFLDHGGVKSTNALTPWRLALEKKGPQVATIVARGFYADASGARDLAYTVRMHFTAGSTSVRIEHTYYYGAVKDGTTGGLTNTTVVNRAFLSIPLVNAPTALSVRAASTVHQVNVAAPVTLEQLKRTPSAPAVAFSMSSNGTSLESGTWANNAFLAAGSAQGVVVAAIDRLSEREPQALRYDPTAHAINVDFTSSPIQIGGARGIWSVAGIDFAPAGADATQRGDWLRLFVERPLLGAPAPAYLNGTQTIGPYATTASGPFAQFFTTADTLHSNTRNYLKTYAITGLQMWPDLPRASCMANYNCPAAATAMFEGGDNNYWNWSKVGIDEFFRTGRNELAYDFSIGEARTFVETLAVRPDHDQIASTNIAGLAPCYGTSRGYDGTFVEGLNQRKDSCPGDYTYDKTLKVAYLATGDQRFVDYFEEAGSAATAAFGAPPSSNPPQFLELSLFRLSEQRLEDVSNGAEFAQDRTSGDTLRTLLRTYVDEMVGKVLVNGHACSTSGTGFNSALALGQCVGNQAWMMPVSIEWAVRTARMLNHAGLNAFLNSHAQTIAKHYTVLGADGHPDYSQLNASASDDAHNGWRTEYSCAASAAGVDEGSCAKTTTIENSGYFYTDGVVAFLNVFGVLLSNNAADPSGICSWLPAMYPKALTAFTADGALMNGNVWGKIPGQAFGMASETIGALTACK